MATLLAEVLQRFAHGRPLGLRRLERPVATFNVRLCLLHGGAGIVEFGLGRSEGVGGILRGFLQRCLLSGELADLGGLLAVFLLDQIEVTTGGDGRGVRLPKRRAILLVCSGGTGDLLPELGLSVFRLFQPLGVVALSGIALLQLIAGLPERTLILSDGVLLQGQRALECVQLVERPAAVFSKSATPALASLKEDCASWICFCTERMLRVKLSLFNDSDTTRSRSVSLNRGSPRYAPKFGVEFNGEFGYNQAEGRFDDAEYRADL